MDRTKPATPPTPDEVEDFAHRLMLARTSPEMDSAAERLFDKVRALLPHFSFIVWSPDDLMEFRPNWSDSDRKAWMMEYGGKVRDAQMEPGWDTLKILLDEYPLEGTDNG